MNTESVLFTDRFVQKEIRTEVINVKISDYDEISSRLITWFKKKWTTGENRNNNLFILSSSFNDYGVPKHTALSYCNQYISKDFNENEISLLVDSAYKNASNFGSKSFEDTKTVNQINKIVNNGGTVAQVIARLGDSEDIVKEYESLKTKFEPDIFWSYNDKGKIDISYVMFDEYLKNKGISKYFPYVTNSDFQFIIKDDNFIDWIDETRIKDIVKTNLKVERGEIEVWDTLARNPSFFKRDMLSMLDTIDVSPKRDEGDKSFLYYHNYAVETTKEKSELIEYKDIDSVVWRNQIIERDIELNSESDGEFKTFIWRLSGENKERYYTLKSVIGYLLHSHQNPSKPKAIIFNDEMISEDVANGGSGKGLIHKAIDKIKNVVIEDGKKFDPRGQFAYQAVNKDTQIFLMDDVDRNFNFESLFSIVTEGMTVEKKGKDSYKIPFEESPKISITTNYTIKGEGASFRRRVFEVEIANHYSDDYQPEEEFGHQFFSGWDIQEWAKFDNFMLRCIQFYLKNGLIESNKVNLEFRKLKNNLGAEFIEFMDGHKIQEKVTRKSFRDKFNSEYPSLARFNTAQRFNKKVKDYCKYNKIDLHEKKYNGIFYFEVPSEEIEEEPPF